MGMLRTDGGMAWPHGLCSILAMLYATAGRIMREGGSSLLSARCQGLLDFGICAPGVDAHMPVLHTTSQISGDWTAVKICDISKIVAVRGVAPLRQACDSINEQLVCRTAYSLACLRQGRAQSLTAQRIECSVCRLSTRLQT